MFYVNILRHFIVLTANSLILDLQKSFASGSLNNLVHSKDIVLRLEND